MEQLIQLWISEQIAANITFSITLSAAMISMAATK